MGMFANPLSHAGYPPGVTGTPTTQPSEVRAATTAEAIAGILDDVYISPATFSGSGSDLGPRTLHGVILGEGIGNPLGATAAGSAGQLLTSGGGAADPLWTTATFPATATGTGTILRANGTNWLASTATYPNTVTAGDIVIATATNVIGSLADVATGQVLMSGGVGVAPAYSGSPSVSGSVTAGTGFTATTGNIVASTGNITSTLGSVSAGTTVTAGTGVTATTGNIVASTGNITSTLGSVGAATTVTAGTTVTATLGDITATNGNFVSSAAGKGLSFNATTNTGAASGPVVLDARAGQVVFSSVSIAAAADLTLTITNSAITGSSTQVIYSMSGATTGAALCIKSVTNTAGSSAIVVTNGTGATTSTADITLNFIVVN